MARPVVPDANVALALTFITPYSGMAAALMERWQRSLTPLYAPLLWEYEVTSALRKACAAGIMATAEAEGALDDCWRLRIERVGA